MFVQTGPINGRTLSVVCAVKMHTIVMLSACPPVHLLDRGQGIGHKGSRTATRILVHKCGVNILVYYPFL